MTDKIKLDKTIPDKTEYTATRLEKLRLEHKELDENIQSLSLSSPHDRLRLQRLKKRKLAIKDQIKRMESGEIPDIIA